MKGEKNTTLERERELGEEEQSKGRNYTEKLVTTRFSLTFMFC